MKQLVVAALLFTVAMSGCLSGMGSSGGRGIAAQEVAANWRAEQDPSAPLIIGDPRTSGSKDWPQAVDAKVSVFDINEDGQDEVIITGKDRLVHVYDSKSGHELATLPVDYPPSWHVENVLNPVTAAALAPGEPVSLVVATPAAIITAWTFEPGKSTDKSFEFREAFSVRAKECHRSPGMDAPAVLANIDGKPGKEILVNTEQTGFYALRNDGSTLWGHCWAGGNAAPVAEDLDGDGDKDVVFVSDSGFISVIDGRTGNPEWTFDVGAKEYGIKPASISVAPAVADLDQDGIMEVIFTARHAPRDDPDAYEDFHMAIGAVHRTADHKVELLWLRQPEWANPLSYTTLVVKDVDGDGYGDIFGMDWNTVGHSPGNWEAFEQSNVFRLDHQGNDVWVRPLDSWWSNKDIAVGDFDGDGQDEVLAVAPRGEQDGIWRLDADTGQPEGFLTAGSWKLSRGPVTFGLDGSLHLAATAQAEDGGDAAVLLYDLRVPRSDEK